MKKYVLLFVLGLLLLACTKDSEVNPTPANAKLEIEASSIDIAVGDLVYFTARSKGSVISDVDFYIKNVAISTAYLFTTVGQFEVVAKKSGYTDSNPIKITVHAKDKVLVLKSDIVEVIVGNTVEFNVKYDGVLQSDATIQMIGGDILFDSTWKATTIGTYSFFASKLGFKDSNVVEIKVVESKSLKDNYIEMGSDKVYLDFSRLSVAAVKNANGTYTPFSYTDEADSTKRYYVFNLDLGVVKSNRYTARANIRLAVYHDPKSNTLVYPGYSTIYPTVFIDSYASLDMMIYKYFEQKDIQQLVFNSPGLSSTINLFFDNNEVTVSYNSDLTNKVLGYVKVDDNGNEPLNKSFEYRTFVNLSE